MTDEWQRGERTIFFFKVWQFTQDWLKESVAGYDWTNSTVTLCSCEIALSRVRLSRARSLCGQTFTKFFFFFFLTQCIFFLKGNWQCLCIEVGWTLWHHDRGLPSLWGWVPTGCCALVLHVHVHRNKPTPCTSSLSKRALRRTNDTMFPVKRIFHSVFYLHCFPIKAIALASCVVSITVSACVWATVAEKKQVIVVTLLVLHVSLSWKVQHAPLNGGSSCRQVIFFFMLPWQGSVAVIHSLKV